MKFYIEREDEGEIELDVSFDYYAGKRGDYWNPPEHPEVEITEATDQDGKDRFDDLTGREYIRMIEDALEEGAERDHLERYGDPDEKRDRMKDEGEFS